MKALAHGRVKYSRFQRLADACGCVDAVTYDKFFDGQKQIPTRPETPRREAQ